MAAHLEEVLPTFPMEEYRLTKTIPAFKVGSHQVGHFNKQ